MEKLPGRTLRARVKFTKRDKDVYILSLFPFSLCLFYGPRNVADGVITLRTIVLRTTVERATLTVMVIENG